jgi:transmembrane sensor
MNVSEKRMHRMTAQVEAADWFVENRDGLDAVKRDAFLKWLKSSPIHIEEYLAIAPLARDIANAVGETAASGSLLERAVIESDGGVESIGVRSNRSLDTAPRTRWTYVAAAAMLAIMCFASWWWYTPGLTPKSVEIPAQRFATRHGEWLTEQLADASVMHLNTDTSVSVRYVPTERRIDIEHGQVAFEVTHDTARPFRVLAGAAEVVAVGTVFDVYVQADSTTVTVVEGRVRVTPSPQSNGAHAGWRPLMVSAGQQVRIMRGELLQGPLQVDAQRATAWLHRQIVFEQEPLADIVAEFNRYSATPIEIESPTLRGLPVSGAFAVDDPDSFLAFLRSLDGVNVQVTATHIRVSKH